MMENNFDMWLDKPEITGQFIIRNACTIIKPPRKGSRIIFVMGVLALPENSEWKGEHQYIAVGSGNTLKVFPESAVDLTDKISGLRADQVLTSKLWRV